MKGEITIMRKNNLLTTIMAAAVAVVMIYTFSGCSDGQSTAATSAAATPTAVQETQKKGSFRKYSIWYVLIGYHFIWKQKEQSIYFVCDF